MKVAKMIMLRWMHGVTKMDKTRNDYIRGSLGLTNIAGKIRENRLRWYRHVERRNYKNIIKMIGEMRVVGNLRKGRLNNKCIGPILFLIYYIEKI